MGLSITKTDVNNVTATGSATTFSLTIKAGTPGVITITPNSPMVLKAIVVAPIFQYDISLEGNLHGSTWNPLEATISRTGLETTLYHDTFEYYINFPIRITFSTLLVPNTNLTGFIFCHEADTTL